MVSPGAKPQLRLPPLRQSRHPLRRNPRPPPAAGEGGVITVIPPARSHRPHPGGLGFRPASLHHRQKRASSLSDLAVASQSWEFRFFRLLLPENLVLIAKFPWPSAAPSATVPDGCPIPEHKPRSPWRKNPWLSPRRTRIRAPTPSMNSRSLRPLTGDFTKARALNKAMKYSESSAPALARQSRQETMRTQ